MVPGLSVADIAVSPGEAKGFPLPIDQFSVYSMVYTRTRPRTWLRVDDEHVECEIRRESCVVLYKHDSILTSMLFIGISRPSPPFLVSDYRERLQLPFFRDSWPRDPRHGLRCSLAPCVCGPDVSRDRDSSQRHLMSEVICLATSKCHPCTAIGNWCLHLVSDLLLPFFIVSY